MLQYGLYITLALLGLRLLIRPELQQHLIQPQQSSQIPRWAQPWALYLSMTIYPTSYVQRVGLGIALGRLRRFSARAKVEMTPLDQESGTESNIGITDGGKSPPQAPTLESWPTLG